MIDEARAEAEKIRDQAIKQLSEERGAAAQELFSQTVELAVNIAQRLLGEVAVPSIEHAFLDRVLDHLDRLPDAEKTALGTDPGASSTVVTTAHPLDTAEEARWREQLGKRIGSRGNHQIQQRCGAYRRRRNHLPDRNSPFQLARRADCGCQRDPSQ